MARHEEIVLFTQPRFVPGGRDEKSVIRKFVDMATFGGSNQIERAASNQFGQRRVSTFLETFREYSESTFTGGVLGFLQAKGMMEVAGVPVDAAGSLAGFVGRIVAGADSGIGKTMGDVGANCNTVYWFRMSTKWFSAKGASSVHGDYNPDSVDVGEDPVVEAARRL